MKKVIKTVLAIGSSAVLAAGCAKPTSPAAEADRHASEQLLQTYQKSQPVPSFDWSQLRQNLIEIETAQVRTTQTTSFFFNAGSTDPIQACPSIGFPIPSSYQLSNPQQIVGAPVGGGTGWSNEVIPQLEPNGVFTGDSSATYVMCVNGSGKTYAAYWEGFVLTISGPAQWDRSLHEVKLTGDPTFDFSAKREK